jgi:recombination protein RecA
MPVKTLDALLKEHDKYVSFADEPKERHYFPSGILALNYIMADNGGRGIPGGSLVQLIGEPKSGKSTLSLDFIAQAQRSGIKEVKLEDRSVNALYLDFEHSFDPLYAELLGVDLTKLLVITPFYAEEGFDLAEAFVMKGIQVVVVDSMGMLIPKDEEDKSHEDAPKVSSEAKPLGRFIKRINALADIHNAVIFFINHYRANISAMARSEKKAYGAWLARYGWKLTIQVRRTGTEVDRAKVEAFIEKTKLGVEGRKTNFEIVFGHGIDFDNHILTLGLGYGMIQKKHTWYSYGDYKSQGLTNVGDFYPMDEIREKVIAALQGE